MSHDVGSIDSFFMQFVMQFVTKKTEKVDQYNTFQDEMGIELYEKLLGLKERFQLKLDLHGFEDSVLR